MQRLSLDAPILAVDELAVTLHTEAASVRALDTVTLQIHAGQVYALLGESGCGKSMTALSIMQLLPPSARVGVNSQILLGQQDLLQLSPAQMRLIRGRDMAMIFQEPMTALNPVLTVAQQLKEVLQQAHGLWQTPRMDGLLSLLAQVGLPNAEHWLTAYPHQLSGGMKQRVMIAMALAGQPKLLIADEPTTALDATIQAQILELLQHLQQQRQMAMLFITHDLNVVRRMADQVGVMYAGHLVEQASLSDFLQQPAHPYSRQLFASLPTLDKRHQWLNVIKGNVPMLTQPFVGCRFASRCPWVMPVCQTQAPPWYEQSKSHWVRCHLFDPAGDQPVMMENHIEPSHLKSQTFTEQPVLRVEQLRVYFPIRKGIFKRTVGYIKAVDGIDFILRQGETLALVGESGSGKTTTGRGILQLVPLTQGSVYYQNQDVSQLRGTKLHWLRRQVQMVMQDPFSSMNPRLLIEQIIAEGMDAHRLYLDKTVRRQRLHELLDQVGLAKTSLQRYPHEFSGGQRQRIAIARALAVNPQLIICDEPTSALDVSVQAQILNLLAQLQQELGLTYLFITHNLNVVGYLADRVAVMQAGRLVEEGLTQQILTQPQHHYTQQLIQAVL
ncbi:MAG: dipeptide ABC transporter ATP-binding protein [Legionellales bacterium]|nr:dipeptide ABC transporter ATP-binding protein [Legionellales bacterium]